MADPVAPAVGAPATAKPAVPPVQGLVRRMINGLEYWFHMESGKVHSAVKAGQSVVVEAETKVEAPSVAVEAKVAEVVKAVETAATPTPVPEPAKPAA